MSNGLPSNPDINTSPAGAGPQAPLAPGSNTWAVPAGCEAVVVKAIPIVPIGQQVLTNEPPMAQGNAGASQA